MTLAFAIAVLLLALPLRSEAQAGTGSRYRVTTKMEMVGMPFAMPAQTNEVCGPKNGAAQAMVPHRDNCQVLDYAINGNKASFRMVCTGREAMTGTGEFEMLGSNGYRGKITVDVQGQQMLMNFDGQRIGDCDYATESPQAVVRGKINQTCDQMLAQPASDLVLLGAQFNGADSMCKAKRTVYCGKILSLATDLKSLRQLDTDVNTMRAQGAGADVASQWDQMKACGMGREAAVAKACPKAKASGDLDFIGAMCPPAMIAESCPKADPNRDADFLLDHCAARAQQLAADNCKARSYSAAGVSGFGQFCNKFAGRRLQQRNGKP
jgi:hypothetical protein